MTDLTDKEFLQLTAYIKSNYGINIKEEKRVLLSGRLFNALEHSGYKSFTEFYEALAKGKSGVAISTLVDRITTNHTFFMRERDHFDYFKSTVLPYLERTVIDHDLRIWCAACSTGEESYTLAMIVDEYFGKNKFFWDTKILATDISERVLEEAKAGIFSADKLKPVPDIWKTNYFKRINENESVVADNIKNEVLYRKFNLMENNFPFRKKFHVIFCRNVMIYFDNETKIQLVNKFYDQMETGGYLFIGHSESIAKNESDFKYIMPSVYRKL